MPLQYRTFTMQDFGQGIDQHSPENRIQEGYLEAGLNVDCEDSGYIKKRTGYQRHLSNFPVRIKYFEDDGAGNICFTLDEGISIEELASTPIVVKGTVRHVVPGSSGDFPYEVESIQYYSGFTNDVKKTFAVGTNTFSISNDETNLDTALAFIGLASSDNAINNSNSLFQADEIRINKSTFEIEVDYTNSTGSSFDGFVYYAAQPAVSGTTYVHTYSASLPDGATTAITIPQSAHNLNNNFIVTRTYLDDGTNYTLVDVESVVLDETTGDVTVSITNNSGIDITDDVVTILTSVPFTNRQTSDLPSGATHTITVSGYSESFIFPSIYLQDIGAGTLELVEFDSISVDTEADEVSFSFTNYSGSPTNFEIYWTEGFVTGNRLCVTSNSTSGAVNKTDNITLSLWGLDHENIYDEAELRGGWVTGIDSYRSVGQSKLVAGLGGLLHEEAYYGTGLDSSLKLSLAYPRLRARTNSTSYVGPVFASGSANRTRGYVLGSNTGNGFATIESISYNDVTGYVDYTLTIDSVDASNYVSGTTISTTTGLEDYFTAQQTGHSFFNGEFKIRAIDDSSIGSGTLIVSVENAAVSTSDFDETDVGGQGGIFTDRLSISTGTPFLTGDRITAGTIFTEDSLIEIKSPSINAIADQLVIGSVVDEVEVPAGLRLIGTRFNTSVIPLRTLNDIQTVENFVAGDMLSYTEFDRKLRIVSINTNDDIPITIDGDGETATVTMGSGDVSGFYVGQKLLLLKSADYSGVITIESITGLTTFTFASAETDTGILGSIAGKTVEIDEAITLEDSLDNQIFYNNVGRWNPVEAPSDSFDATEKNYFNHFDSFGATAQSFLRSTMVNDNLYFTNGEDEVMKYDGVNVYRAGLPRWQPQLFITTNTSASAVIDVADTRQADIDSTSLAEGNMRVTVDTSGGSSATTFIAGDSVTIQNGGGDKQNLTIASIDSTNDYVYFTSKVTISSPTLLSIRNVYRYYFRLNAIDRNNNIVASATTGVSDYEIELTENAAIQIRLVGMPLFGNYDYDRIDVEVYRTKAGQLAPFYRADIVKLNFNNKRGYFDVLDANSNDDLTELDPVNTALLGAEVGTSWSEPLRADYVTSDGNRLILGNVKSYPQLDMRFFKGAGTNFSAELEDRSFLFKKDNTDASSTPNMVDRAGYEFTNTNIRTLNAASYDAGSKTIFVTVTASLPSLSAGDWVYLYHSSKKTAATNQISGWAQVVDIVSTTELQLAMDVQSVISFNVSTHADKILLPATSKYVPILTDTDYNYENEPEYTDFTAARRFANAINASMRLTDYSLSGQETFIPWLNAAAGGEFAVGQVSISIPSVFNSTSDVTLPGFTDANFKLFINNSKATGSSSVDFSTTVFPSRVLGSYPNYPEIFDNPLAKLDTESSSAISVNSSDGQQLTGLLPFFGSSAFGAAQKSSVVVAFKENSIYLLDYSIKAQNQQALQRLESRGLGCKYPYSIAPTRYGIIFATTGGIYKLNRNMQVQYVGEKVDRIWKQQLNLTGDVTLFHGTQYALENTYKLSVVLTGETTPSDVLTYDHTREGVRDEFGAWSRYDNHPSIGWANLDDRAFFASTNGKVYVLRNTGTDSDFRDDDAPISMDILFRMWDLGDSAIRKAFRSVRLHFRTVADMEGTTLLSAINSTNSFDENLPFALTGNESSDGLSDVNSERISSIKFRIDRRKGTYLQLRLQNNTLDEPVELTHLDIKAAPLKYRGTTEASDTTR